MKAVLSRLIPKSLYGRLLASAGLFIVIALVLAGLSIGRVLERFVMRGLDSRLDSQIVLLQRAVRDDASLDPRWLIDAPPFDRRGSGWLWQIRTPARIVNSASLSGRTMPVPVLRPRDERRRQRSSEARPVDGISADGTPIHFRVLTLETAVGPVTITAAGPRAIAERPLRQALVPLAWSLAILGIVLIAAIMLQLRFGLRPLGGLQRAVADVRAGRARHVPGDQPLELQPLATELNALIDANDAGLDNARRHVANLAHGLKTPLAALQLKLAEAERDPDGTIAALAAQMNAAIRHHLSRARAASPGGTAARAVALKPHVDDLVATLSRIHADRAVAVSLDLDDTLTAACDPQDVDEMLGNLLDNAFRWATSAIELRASRDRNRIVLTIADDGPGLSEAARADALIAGRRLDERGEGHGFGLSIARELAELYGGSLMLGRAESGGLAVTLTLPAVVG